MFRIYTYSLGMMGVRVRAKISYEYGIYFIYITDYSIFYEILKSTLRGHVGLYPIREYFGDYPDRLGRNSDFFCKDFLIQFKVRGVEMLN